MTDSFEAQPIATVVGGRTDIEDDYWGGVQSVIRVDPRFPAETLQGIDAFSTWSSPGASTSPHPATWRCTPAAPATTRHGRPRARSSTATTDGRTSSPCPSRVWSRSRAWTHVTDLDAVEGTPIIDLAPYFRAMGPQGPTHEPEWPGEMLADYWAAPRG